jgi:hypothetical protein
MPSLELSSLILFSYCFNLGSVVWFVFVGGKKVYQENFIRGALGCKFLFYPVCSFQNWKIQVHVQPDSSWHFTSSLLVQIRVFIWHFGSAYIFHKIWSPLSINEWQPRDMAKGGAISYMYPSLSFLPITCIHSWVHMYFTVHDVVKYSLCGIEICKFICISYF